MWDVETNKDYTFWFGTTKVKSLILELLTVISPKWYYVVTKKGGVNNE